MPAEIQRHEQAEVFTGKNYYILDGCTDLFFPDGKKSPASALPYIPDPPGRSCVYSFLDGVFVYPRDGVLFSSKDVSEHPIGAYNVITVEGDGVYIVYTGEKIESGMLKPTVSGKLHPIWHYHHEPNEMVYLRHTQEGIYLVTLQTHDDAVSMMCVSMTHG